MDLGIAGRRAAVAAASKGLGFAAAAALVAEGVHVAMCSRNRDEIEAAAAKLGDLATPLVADVGTAEGAAGFVDSAREHLGGVDILVANAGGPPPGTFSSFDGTDAYAKAFELNALSTISMCQHAIPAMREQGWGRVVAITSIAVRQPIATLILVCSDCDAEEGFDTACGPPRHCPADVSPERGSARIERARHRRSESRPSRRWRWHQPRRR